MYSIVFTATDVASKVNFSKSKILKISSNDKIT